MERLRAQLGLDQPVWVQYGRFMVDALRGDLGTSIQSNRPALNDVMTAFPVTLQLALASLLHRSPNILLIPGTSSRKHLRENLKAASLEVPSEVLANLNSIGKPGKEF